MKKTSPWIIFASIILAICFGTWVGQDRGFFGVSWYSIMDLIATLFINALSLVVVPLVSSSIITGIARIANERSFGRLGGKMFLFYISTTLMAILIGLVFVNVLQPGASSIAPVHSSMEDASLEAARQTASLSGVDSLFKILLQMIPANILAPFSPGQMLSLIVFSLLFGYALSKIDAEPKHIVQGFWQGIFQTMLRITHLILKFLPLGVFCLVGKVFAISGIQSLSSLALFSATVLLGLFTFMFIALPLMLRFVAKVHPLRHFRAMAPAIITAFSTSSSSATLPVTIDCVEKRAGVSNRICSLVIPLGTSVNMSGSALYECVAAIFVAQVYGLPLALPTQCLIVLLSLVTSIGVAGIPAGSLVAMLILLRSIGLPAEGIGLFIAVERLLDMCRTAVNVFSDSCCAIFVAKSEGEDVLKS